MKKVIVVNTKGGASKSTVALQVVGTYFLQRGENIALVELDDENQDSAIFSDSLIKTSTAFVGTHEDDILLTLRELFSNNKLQNLVLDIGGNKTTTMVINALERSRLYHLMDLFIIPMSGGNQDYANAIKTYEMIKHMGKPVIFGLSRVRRLERVKSQYQEFFRDFPDFPFIILTDSDTIDLSRRLNKSVYELAIATSEGNLIEQYDKLIYNEMEKNDNQDEADKLVDVLDILKKSVDYKKDILEPCYKELDKVLV